MKFEEYNNEQIFLAFCRAKRFFIGRNNICVSVSGGSDSDIMMDFVIRAAEENGVPIENIHFVFFDTGIEYQATKKHLDYLQNKYGVKIDRVRAITPVPKGCKMYGLPFWSKEVSEKIERLQRHGFKWEDKPFSELLAEYPKCKASLRWWCNDFGENSRFNINYIKWLKEYMIENPPQFRISNKCCNGAKKDNAKAYLKQKEADMNIVGIRKAEGGARASAYKSCFDEGFDYCNYRPIFWFTDKDKRDYETLFGVTHSDCYCKYGLKRTGCVGCPFGKDFEKELEIVKEYEPKLFSAVNNIFGASYEYTRKFYEFRKAKQNENQT